jgi:hypothetical protein
MKFTGVTLACSTAQTMQMLGAARVVISIGMLTYLPSRHSIFGAQIENGKSEITRSNHTLQE